jgi:SAM-dependent methyltransferase
MSQNNGSTKHRKQQHLYVTNSNSSSHHHHHASSSSNGIGSSGGTSSRSPPPPASYVLTLFFNVASVSNNLAKKIGLKLPQSLQSYHPQLHRLGGLVGVVLTIYIISSSLLFYLHSSTHLNNHGTVISQQQQQPTTPLYLTNSEQDLISKVLGINHNNKVSMTKSRQSKQCTASMEIRIPPTTLRKGKSQFVTEIEYQNQAVQLVHNIRILLGMATQLGQRQSMLNQPMDDLSSTLGNTTSDSKSAAAKLSSLLFQLSTKQSEIKSFDSAVIMDYGCGPGRLLIGLLSANVCFTKYIGVDVNNKDIEWLTDTYINKKNGNDKRNSEPQKWLVTGTQKLQLQKQRNRSMRYIDKSGIYKILDEELFQFIRVDVKNERYNKNGQTLDTDSLEKKERIVFPSIEIHDRLVNTVDIMIVRSVFSHMLTSDIYHHLRALHPILKSNSGIMIVSMFLNTIPESPVETVVSKETQQRGNHLVYISKQVFETILYETGYSIVLYLSQWNMGEDVYVLSSNGSKQPSPLFVANDDEGEEEKNDELSR